MNEHILSVILNAGLIGIISVSVRFFVPKPVKKFVDAISYLICAVIASIWAGLYLESHQIPIGYKFAIISIVGVVSKEIVHTLIKIAPKTIMAFWEKFLK